jgi:hypothetical protein
MGQDRRDVPQTGVLIVYTEGSLRATPKASRRQLNNLTLERCEVEHPLTIRPGEINSLGDCIEDVSRAFSFVVTARCQALTQCEVDGRGWKPEWTPWQVVRLPRTGSYEFGQAGLGSVPLLLREEGTRLIATVLAASAVPPHLS